MPVESRQRAFKRQCPMLPKSEEKERPPALWGMPNSRSKKVNGRKEPARVHNARLGKRSTMPYIALGKCSQKTELVCTRHLACTCDAHRSRRTLLAPAGVLVAVAVTTRSVACLTLTAATPTVIWARRIVELKLLLRRRVIRGRWIGWCALSLALNMPYR